MSAKVIRHPRTGQVIDVEAEPTRRGPGYADRFAGARGSRQAPPRQAPPRQRAQVQYDEYGDEIEDDYYDEEEGDYYEDEPPRRARGRGRRRGKVRMGHSPQADAIRNGKANKRRPRTRGRGRGRGQGYAGQTVVCEAPKERNQWGKLLLTGAIFAVAGYAVKAGLDRVTGKDQPKDNGESNGQAPQPQAIPQQAQVNPVHQLLLTSPGANRLMPAYAGGTIQAPQPPPMAVALPAPKKNPKRSDDEDFEDEVLSYMDRYVQDFDESEDEDEDDDF